MKKHIKSNEALFIWLYCAIIGILLLDIHLYYVRNLPYDEWMAAWHYLIVVQRFWIYDIAAIALFIILPLVVSLWSPWKSQRFKIAATTADNNLTRVVVSPPKMPTSLPLTITVSTPLWMLLVRIAFMLFPIILITVAFFYPAPMSNFSRNDLSDWLLYLQFNSFCIFGLWAVTNPSHQVLIADYAGLEFRQRWTRTRILWQDVGLFWLARNNMTTKTPKGDSDGVLYRLEVASEKALIWIPIVNPHIKRFYTFDDRETYLDRMNQLIGVIASMSMVALREPILRSNSQHQWIFDKAATPANANLPLSDPQARAEGKAMRIYARKQGLLWGIQPSFLVVVGAGLMSSMIMLPYAVVGLGQAISKHQIIGPNSYEPGIVFFACFSIAILAAGGWGSWMLVKARQLSRQQSPVTIAGTLEAWQNLSGNAGLIPCILLKLRLNDGSEKYLPVTSRQLSRFAFQTGVPLRITYLPQNERVIAIVPQE